jgi:hypothetical protein
MSAAEIFKRLKLDGANRFLWVCTKRSKLLLEGESFESVDLSGLTQRVREAVNFAAGVGRLCRDEHAKQAWCAYPVLIEAKPGIFGAVTGRADSSVIARCEAA